MGGSSKIQSACESPASTANRFIIGLGLLISTAAGDHIDVRAAFKHYCSSFCGKGGYSICDIGSGNIHMESTDLVNGTAPFFVETAFNESDVGGRSQQRTQSTRQMSAT